MKVEIKPDTDYVLDYYCWDAQNPTNQDRHNSFLI